MLRIRKPDDWHLHLRDGAALRSVAHFSASQFGRGLIMPNLKPPVTTFEAAKAYRQRICDALPPESEFQPMMTLYLTDETDVKELTLASQSEFVLGCKLYPMGATTNSAHGVTDISKLDHVFDAMASLGLVLQVHGELTHDPMSKNQIDVFDREAEFLSTVLAPLIKKHPKLRIVLEHITTQAAADFVAQAPDNIGATITAHHLICNRNDMLSGGIRPHLYCLPILKRERDRQALVKAATSGDSSFFLGTDSAPHSRGSKESECGCAGTFTAPHAMLLYAGIFEEACALDKLENFASCFGADFYRLPQNQGELVLEKKKPDLPKFVSFGAEETVLFPSEVSWSFA